MYDQEVESCDSCQPAIPSFMLKRLLSSGRPYCRLTALWCRTDTAARRAVGWRSSNTRHRTCQRRRFTAAMDVRLPRVGGRPIHLSS